MHGVRSGDLGGQELRWWSWLPLHNDLSSVVVSADLGSYGLHPSNVDEFEYHLDIFCVADGDHIED